jgi:hypothetical protein
MNMRPLAERSKKKKEYDSSDLPPTNIKDFIDRILHETLKVSKREKSGERGTLDVTQSIDGLGRLIQTKSEYVKESDL